MFLRCAFMFDSPKLSTRADQETPHHGIFTLTGCATLVPGPLGAVNAGYGRNTLVTDWLNPAPPLGPVNAGNGRNTVVSGDALCSTPVVCVPTVMTTDPLDAVPAAFVTVKPYVPCGTAADTERLMGKRRSLAPDVIDAVIPACVNVTAFAKARFEPVTSTRVMNPRGTVSGAAAVIVGAATIENTAALVAVPFVFVTLIGPVAAPTGTVATIEVAVADVTLASVPAKRTVFCSGSAMNPEPTIVTLLPTTPRPGDKERIETCDADALDTDSKFPAASYV
jgi:hypothetical protein